MTIKMRDDLFYFLDEILWIFVPISGQYRDISLIPWFSNRKISHLRGTSTNTETHPFSFINI